MSLTNEQDTFKKVGLWSLQWRHNEQDNVSNHQPHDCILKRLFGRRSKITSKLRVTGLCAGNSPGTGEFPAQRASNAENVSIWWRHHGGLPLREWDLTLEIQHNTSALHNVIRLAIRLKAPEKILVVCVMCSYFLPFYVIGSNKEYFELNLNWIEFIALISQRNIRVQGSTSIKIHGYKHTTNKLH